MKKRAGIWGKLGDASFDIQLKWILLLGFAAVVIRFVFVSMQQIFLYPGESNIDDMLMIRGAMSIVEGKWLGTYDWLTLSKHSFYSLWLAVLHWLKVPVLYGSVALWVCAALAAAWALFPVLKKRWLALGLFLLVLYNPAAVANPSPYGFTLRVYRDGIFPALCVLCIVGIVGYALRLQQEISKSAGWLVVSGLAFGACWLTREDGWWLLPFMIIASLCVAGLLFWKRENKAFAKVALLALPFLLLLVCTLGWRGMNYRYYGRFILSDFSTGEFADAYGAMTRINHESWNPRVAVPKEVREKLYATVPEMAALEPYLEDGWYLGRYAGDDYSSGGFYWALREAAYDAGFYETPQTAKAFWESMANNINSLCEEGVFDCGPKRSSVNPPIRVEYILPVAKETFYNLYFCATFQQYDPSSMRSIGDYETEIRPLEEFLHSKALMAAKENTDLPYHSPRQVLAYKLLSIVRFVYLLAVPVLLGAALVWQCLNGAEIIRKIKQKKHNKIEIIGWLIQLGLVFCILLRSAMIAFVNVSSFGIGVYIMYLATIHPLMILFGYVGTVQLLFHLWEKKKSKEDGRQQKAEA